MSVGLNTVEETKDNVSTLLHKINNQASCIRHFNVKMLNIISLSTILSNGHHHPLSTEVNKSDQKLAFASNYLH